VKALSIRQPWTWAILHAGKDIENRVWGERYPGLREARALQASGAPFLIHASTGMTADEYEDFIDTAHAISRVKPFNGLVLPPAASLPRGVIVGQARIAAIAHEHSSPWFFGPIGLVLADVKALPITPMKGALSFFEVSKDIVAKLMEPT
jgi:hypothetical protein